jgi:hypothetical protein
MAVKLELDRSLQARQSLSERQKKNIAAMYSDLLHIVQDELKGIKGSITMSDAMRMSYLNTISKQLKIEIEHLGRTLRTDITKGMDEVAKAVVEDNILFAKSLSVFEIQGAFSNVPTDVVARITSGRIYGGNWNLSRAIWSDVLSKQSQIEEIVAKGVALNKSTYDIAKDLETFVDPKAVKTWEWSKVYPNTSRKIDYNAQRLARTLVSHAYQQSMVLTAKPNPFVTGFIWHSAHSSRVCEICAERDSQFYTKDELPLDHPNGMCHYEAATDPEIGDKLAQWVSSPSGSYPDIDKYAAVLAGRR